MSWVGGARANVHPLQAAVGAFLALELVIAISTHSVRGRRRRVKRREWTYEIPRVTAARTGALNLADVAVDGAGLRLKRGEEDGEGQGRKKGELHGVGFGVG